MYFTRFKQQQKKQKKTINTSTREVLNYNNHYDLFKFLDHIKEK